MTTVDQLTDEQLDRHAFKVLMSEFGPDGLARFLRLHQSGPGDYTQDRDLWQKDLKLEDVLKSIQKCS